MVTSEKGLAFGHRLGQTNSMNVQEVKANLSNLLDQVVAGETIIVSRHNKPIAELRPLSAPAPPPPTVVGRKAGLLKGQIRWKESAFQPMPDSELADFDNSPLFPAQSKGQTSGQ